jgi:hypothetical protein
VSCVGDHHLSGIDQRRVESLGLESSCNQLAGESLAVGENVIGGAGSEFANRRYTPQQFVKNIELALDLGVHLAELFGAEQGLGRLVMALAETTGEVQRVVSVALAGCARHGDECIRHLRHGADDNEWSLRETLANDIRHSLDRFCIFDGRSAELHYDHRT